MNNFVGSLDTDMAIGSILSNFETPWVMNSVQDSLNMKFRPFSGPMPNFVDILERQFNSITVAGPDFKTKIDETRIETYKEIIQAICSSYSLVFTEPFENISPMELYGIAHTMYDIFISRFTEYMVEFYIKYILTNMDSIYTYLMSDDTVKKPKDKEVMANYIDPKFHLIHANLNKIIMDMTGYDIPLSTLLSSFVDSASAERLCNLLTDTGDIYKYHYAAYLHDQRYMADLLTSIKLKLQSKTQQAFTINSTM